MKSLTNYSRKYTSKEMFVRKDLTTSCVLFARAARSENEYSVSDVDTVLLAGDGIVQKVRRGRLQYDKAARSRDAHVAGVS